MRATLEGLEALASRNVVQFGMRELLVTCMHFNVYNRSWQWQDGLTPFMAVAGWVGPGFRNSPEIQKIFDLET